jgi:hypothetical protein
LGYRLFGVTGVATSVGQFASDYNSLAASGSVDADDSILIHGGYIGIDWNW